MEYIKKTFIIVLVILTLNLYLPKMALAQQQFASADVPKHEPQSWGTPEEDIPAIKKKTSGWTWVILLALIGGVAAAVGGGDSGGDGGTSTAATTTTPTTTPTTDGGDSSSDTGSYTGTW